MLENIKHKETIAQRIYFFLLDLTYWPKIEVFFVLKVSSKMLHKFVYIKKKHKWRTYIVCATASQTLSLPVMSKIELVIRVIN